MPGTVNPSEGDNRLMVWATTDPDAALRWAFIRYEPKGETLYAYEVTLADPEVDINHHRAWEVGPFTSVMARSGSVLRLVREVLAAEFSPPN